MSADELAATATAAADSGGASASLRVDLGGTLGRFAIERVLGAGGMGIVYAAFDPELERRVALKVLRPGLAPDAGERLLREARAMARLADPNIVAVYEVGTTDGHDYIAMELVDGENLVEWRRTANPDARAVLAVYIAAGRGLATAHESSIVHRDFKPHNVLRSRRGRVVVTDFGLAREATSAPLAIAPTPIAGGRAPTSLSGLTEPGSLLGTPAYMAPEQWDGGDVTPATDQFAFCVALWEALAGERPFKGETLDELRAQITGGSGGLDAARIPRRLRRALTRGLAVRPAARWPSMTALLAHLERRPRWVTAAVASVSVALAAGGAALVLGSHAATPTLPAAAIDACAPPAVALGTVWGPAEQQAIRAGSREAADRLGAAFDRWQVVRAGVCAEPAAARTRRLACLDRVLVRLDAIRRGRLFEPAANLWAVFSQPYDPEVCLREDPPRMPERMTDAAIVGLAVRGGIVIPPDALAAARAAMPTDACARAYLGFLGDGVQALTAAESAAQLCNDDQAYATAKMNELEARTTLFLDPAWPQTVREAEGIVERGGQTFLTRQYELFRARTAELAGDLDASVAFVDQAAGTESKDFDLKRRVFRVGVLLERDAPGDREEVAREAAALHEVAHAGTLDAVIADAIQATAAWLGGDVDHAHAALVAANAKLQQEPDPAGAPLAGVVVDARGAPVAGASVAAAETLVGDAAGIGLPLFSHDGFPQAIQRATTGPDGRFAFAHVPPGVKVAAQAGAQRSPVRRGPAASRLVLAPTAAVRGTVHAPASPGQLWIVAAGAGSDEQIIAPVQADGSFALAGLPVGEVDLSAVRFADAWSSSGPARRVRTGGQGLDGIEVPPPSPRVLDVLVRSTAGGHVDGAFVTAIAGTVHPTRAGEVDELARATGTATDVARAVPVPPPPAIATLLRRGDVFAHLRGAPTGAITVCARGVEVDAQDPAFWATYSAHQAAQPVRCVAVAATDTQVVVEVPPMARIDR